MNYNLKFIEIFFLTFFYFFLFYILDFKIDYSKTQEYQTKKNIMTYSRIIYGLTNWKDIKCDDNLICIDSEYFEKDKDKPHYFLKKYSQPYNNPTLKFVIFCDTEETENYILFILSCELEEYLTGPFDWYKNFDIKCIKNILEKEELGNYEILMEGEDMLVKFEEEEYRKHKEYNDILKLNYMLKKKRDCKDS